MEKGRRLRCPWCLGRDVENELLYDSESNTYRCARCCFAGTKEKVEELYLALSEKSTTTDPGI